MEISKKSLQPSLLYDDPIKYGNITLYPVTMKDVILFQTLSQSITVRKNSTFHEKNIIKMSYLEFLFYSFQNVELESAYKIPSLSQYLLFAIQLLHICCRDAKINIAQNTGAITINGDVVTPEVFDDLRRIIIIQNGIDFDIDEFLNYDTEQRLLKAQKDLNKDENVPEVEDMIDSLVVALNTTEQRVKEMSIRKFWRYVKRYRLHEDYTIMKTGECSGFVTFKEPIKHWMSHLDDEDKYKDLKTDENELRSKMG